MIASSRRGNERIPDLSKSKLDSPHLSLIFQAISADELEPKSMTREKAYSLVSLSFSKGLLGLFAVFESAESAEIALTVRVRLAHCFLDGCR